MYELQFTQMFVFFIPLQCSSQSDPTSVNQQVQLLLEEKQQLEAHNHQVCVQRVWVDIHLKSFDLWRTLLWYLF